MKRGHHPFFCPFLCDDVSYLPVVLIHITLAISPLNPFLSGLWNFLFTFFFLPFGCVRAICLPPLKIHWFSLPFNLHAFPKFQPPKTFLFPLSSLFFALQTILALFAAGASTAFLGFLNLFPLSNQPCQPISPTAHCTVSTCTATNTSSLEIHFSN